MDKTNLTQNSNFNKKDHIRKILNYATLAPSSHNTQPWLFSVEQQTIHVWVDESRKLASSDPTDRELYISVGCSIENALNASEAIGYKYKLELFPSKDDKNHVAKITLSDFSEKDDSKIKLSSIINRKSNRAKYSKTTINQKTLTALKSVGEKTNIEIFFIDSEPRLTKIKNIMINAFNDALQTKSFREELSEWIRPNTKKTFDGMPGYTLNIPTIPSLLIPWLLKNTNPAKKMVGENKKFLDATPTIGILTSKENNPHGWVDAGIQIEKVWLEATRLGLAFNVLNAAVEIGDYYKKVQEVIDTKLRPLVIWRLGYETKTASASPRIPFIQRMMPSK